MKQLIDSKPDIGRIMRIDCECSSFLPDWRPGTDYRHGNSVQKEGGGVILELSHELDYLQWFFGDITLKSSSIFTRDNDLEVEDCCFNVLQATVSGDKVPIRLTLDFSEQTQFEN